MSPTPADVRLPWRDDPRAKLAAELYCLLLTVVPHKHNSHLRTAVTVLLVLAWSAITVGVAFDLAQQTTTYGVLSAVVWTIVGRMWGIEIQTLAGLDADTTDSDDDSDR